MTIASAIEAMTSATGRLVHAASDEQLAGTSPCADWDGRTVLNHIVRGMQDFAGAFGGVTPGGDPRRDVLGDDPARAYDEAAAALLEALRRPGAFDATVNLGMIGELPGEVAAAIALMELGVHGWDLARATGQVLELDDATGQALDAAARQVVQPQFRVPGVFDAEQPVPDDAPLIDRVAAFAGRRV